METVISLLLATFLIAASIYLLVFAVASFFDVQIRLSPSDAVSRILVMLPVYKEDEVILESARKALALNYDKRKFDVCVIADSLQGVTREKLKDMGCVVVKMDITPRSKAKAINLALQLLPVNVYDICLVLDADNYLSPDALIKINAVYNSGAKAIQCQRVAKEITTPVSVLDAISEGINNTIFRKGHRVLGLSAALSGSGMAFDYTFFKEVMGRIEATNGFDKDLEFEIISEGVTIQYLESVEVFDEKVSSLDVLKKQRTRWFAAQLINISKGFRFVRKNPSVDLFDKWFQMWLPSRLLLFGFMLFVTVLSFLFQTNVFTLVFAGATVLTALSLLLASPKKYLGKNFFSVVVHLPVSFFTLILSFFSFHKARRGFIHTPHHSSSKV
jgi:cellulose synthase/poly-beta-1,6-N-acetylglucosamine synthase-like glycosyltransferase